MAAGDIAFQKKSSKRLDGLGLLIHKYLGVVHILYKHARGGGGVREMLMISYVEGRGVDQMLM